ncbi:MAG TPA: formylglycine-generating enzyme family protein [Thermotogota bacterium]|nr:formylglycine-generating enzyme family protein [Thermotogota bacterium]
MGKTSSWIALMGVGLIGILLFTACVVAEANNPPPRVDLLFPEDEALVLGFDVVLEWEGQPGQVRSAAREGGLSIVGYLLYFSGADQPYGKPEQVTGEKLEITGLANGTAYKWQVAAMQSDGQVATSVEHTFITLGMNEIPPIVLTWPENFSTGVATSLTLTWDTPLERQTDPTRAASFTAFDVYLAKATEDYDSPERVTAKELQATGLEYGTLYKWKVVGLQSDGASVASEQWVFTTVEESYNIPQVSLQSPGYGATMVSRNPTLSWEATPGTQNNNSPRAAFIENYELYFAKAGNNYASPVVLGEKSFEKQDLDPYTEYKWKVVANQSDGQQATTPEATFLTVYTFLMGDSQGVVFTYEFEMGNTEVTFEQYDAYCDSVGASKPGDSGFGRGSRPVINVSWKQAVRYCNWLSEVSGLPRAYDEFDWQLVDPYGAPTTDITEVKGWRLPTEAEWEYFARGGAADITDGVEAHDYLYAGSDRLGYVGWYEGNSDQGAGMQTHTVRQKSPNELGLYDMSGNVFEWCHDWYAEYSADTQVNPIGPETGSQRVIRGGCWALGANLCQVKDRNPIDPKFISNGVGFRIAKTQ